MIIELRIPYPDFKMGDMIDPEQHDMNNLYLQSKINELVSLVNQFTGDVSGAQAGAEIISLKPIPPFTQNKIQTFLETLVARLQSISASTSGAQFIGSAPIAGVTGSNVLDQLRNIVAQLVVERGRIDTTNTRLDGRIDTTNTRIDGLTTRMTTAESNINNRYTKAEITSLLTPINASITALQTGLATHNHDARYMTRDELKPFLGGGNTKITIDVFTILSSDPVAKTFTYRNGAGTVFTGALVENGGQEFTLSSTYSMNSNYISAIVNDTLHRSVASGGLKEISTNKVVLTYPEAIGAEITFNYFSNVGITGEHSVIYGTLKPAPSQNKFIWYKVVSP